MIVIYISGNFVQQLCTEIIGIYITKYNVIFIINMSHIIRFHQIHIQCDEFNEFLNPNQDWKSHCCKIRR